ncbi:hypothetical protein A3C32_04350 [Candidatus Daviesbacteria bacterium RIFCSPHIGHO2_02_FULL_41_14]|uniref:SAM-dependent methyltransferase n=1 Tax=Candidatus Daviesbacteria bacterium RIFCSPLOWO2_01_FULL_40_24 TaxID=1797787 RepID=A0A1F5MJC5_9BACT|nr:MAG: hypothetical protein A3C32_04350 [Candidatus Daviesbacteria bacterium RIFCSPHIGHO2_02_FULL_41_14]OGE65458.1 MAG: hypothetical protein A3B49_01045 [Candidatus Daviesbacteria bacterium RIFCSPLOWO2_01_FULL_40_24]
MVHPSSFRDPSGEIFLHQGQVYRNISKLYKENYLHLINSGLYQELVRLQLLIPHKEVRSIKSSPLFDHFKTIKPLQIPFISYPYEWSISQLKDAALTILTIQKIALEHQMILKDASAYNIQFFQGKPILIDTLSFEKYQEGQPWIAYRQFCMHFLAPLMLMKHTDRQLNKLMQLYIDGIPLDLASKLLPVHTYLNRGILFHLHLHSKAQVYFASRHKDTKKSAVSRRGLEGLQDDLSNIVEKITLADSQTEWGDYYNNHNYSIKALAEKSRLVSQLVKQTRPKTIWDFGSNNGMYSHLFKRKDLQIVSFDYDTQAVESNYLYCRKYNLVTCLPLLMDLKNPSPEIGWGNQERYSLTQRGPTDTLLVLALLHHLVITNNIPFIKLAQWFNQLCQNMIIEFVPKTDSQVKKLLANRDNFLYDYDVEQFERVFSKHFRILKKQHIQDSERIIYLMKTRGGETLG